jgi:hypothetical protein
MVVRVLVLGGRAVAVLFDWERSVVLPGAGRAVLAGEDNGHFAAGVGGAAGDLVGAAHGAGQRQAERHEQE